MHFQFNLFISFPFYFSSIMLQLRTQQSLTTQFSRKLDHRRSAFSCYNQVLKTLSEKNVSTHNIPQNVTSVLCNFKRNHLPLFILFLMP